ncbi:Or9e3 [Eciton burchellii]|nr:Or9e3 [Eciton burchellii]
MDAFCRHYYDIAYKLSSIVGMWPYLEPKTKLFRTSLLTVIILSVFIPQVAYQYMCGMKLRCTTQNFASLASTIMIVIMLYTFQSKACIIKILMEYLFISWKELKCPREYEIIKSYAENNRRFILLYSIYLFLTSSLFLLIPLVPLVLDVILPLNESRPILSSYPSYYFVDIEKYFFQIFLHAFVAWQFIVTGMIAHDCIFITYVEHICSLFAVIGYRFERLFSKETMKIRNTLSSDIHCKRIASFVDMHQKILEMAQLIEDIFSIPFIIHLYLITVVISITLLQITQEHNHIWEIIKYIVYVGAQLIHLFILSLEGQKLIDHSFQVRIRIYNSSWYNVSVKSQKLIMMVMVKCLRPSFLSAGNVYIFSLKNFVMILHASMSYFTMLSSFQ